MLFCCPIVQVSYTRNKHTEINTVTTNVTSVELVLPADDNYIIQICALSDSGDGMPTEPINIHKLSKKPCSNLVRVDLLSLSLVICKDSNRSKKLDKI